MGPVKFLIGKIANKLEERKQNREQKDRDRACNESTGSSVRERHSWNPEHSPQRHLARRRRDSYDPKYPTEDYLGTNDKTFKEAKKEYKLNKTNGRKSESNVNDARQARESNTSLGHHNRRKEDSRKSNSVIPMSKSKDQGLSGHEMYWPPNDWVDQEYFTPVPVMHAPW